ncbi:hypothetical protein [Nannocystis pusilla]|uniref:hypothetical protein n=1 Tax=Nannocystis pusilla TaxID=889268 RepID=UPI001CC99DA5|nr:hypothetical protein [Nannocystis pusilla]
MCYREAATCTTLSTTPEQACSLYHYATKDKAGEFPYAEFAGHCDESAGEFYPTPPCLCDYGDSPPTADICIPVDDGGGSGSPTTTADPTGDPVLEKYVCSQVAQSTCREYDYLDLPDPPNDKQCWVHDQLSDNHKPCVDAYSIEEAEMKCASFCSKAEAWGKAEYIDAYNEDDTTGDPKDWVTPAMDCVIDGDPHVVSLKDPLDICVEEDVYPLPEWDGASPLVIVELSAALTTLNGGSTALQDVTGYIGYQVTNCVSGVCDITIDALEGIQTDVAGIFTAADGSRTDYAIEGLDFRLIQTWRGKLNEARGTVTFPDSPFVGNVSAEAYSIGGVPMGDWKTTAIVEQAVGSLRNNTLTLNLTVNLTDGVFLVSLQTM